MARGVTISRLRKQIQATDDELSFIEDIEKHNKGQRASRSRTIKAQELALPKPRANRNKISKTRAKPLTRSLKRDKRSKKSDQHITKDIKITTKTTQKDTKSDPNATKISKHIKLWLRAGLYSKSYRSKTPKFNFPLPKSPSILNTPKDFAIPWNIYAPSNGERKVVKWKSLKRNIWNTSRVDPKSLKNVKSRQMETCDCQGTRCGDSCFNRLFQIECDTFNCNLGPSIDCGNRNFANLNRKLARNSRYANGVEVVSAGDKGDGLRAVRLYLPHDLIIEYTGEIIDQEEVERRLNEDTVGQNRHYYFLSLGKGLSIDGGTRGSIARFANHSCDPNAEVQKWTVNGEPRAGLFAGAKGIQTGEEITYHYNFKWFPNAKPQPCYCGSANCSGFIGRRHHTYSPKQSTPPTPISRSSSPQPTRSSRTKKSSPSLSESSMSSTSNSSSSKDLKVRKQKLPDTNPYEKPVTSITRRSRLNRHPEDASFSQIAASLPRHVQRQLSINMAPPGSEFDDVSFGMTQLLATAKLKPSISQGSRRITRDFENKSALGVGIPVKYLKSSGTEDSKGLSKVKAKVLKSAVIVKRKEKKTSVKKTKKEPQQPKDKKLNTPVKKLETRKLQENELQQGKLRLLMKKLLIDDEVPLVGQRTTRNGHTFGSDESTKTVVETPKRKYKRLKSNQQVTTMDKESYSKLPLGLRKLFIDDGLPKVLDSRSRKEEPKLVNKAKAKPSKTTLSIKVFKKSPKVKETRDKDKKLPLYLSKLLIDDKLPVLMERHSRQVKPNVKYDTVARKSTQQEQKVDSHQETNSDQSATSIEVTKATNISQPSQVEIKSNPVYPQIMSPPNLLPVQLIWNPNNNIVGRVPISYSAPQDKLGFELIFNPHMPPMPLPTYPVYNLHPNNVYRPPPPMTSFPAPNNHPFPPNDAVRINASLQFPSPLPSSKPPQRPFQIL